MEKPNKDAQRILSRAESMRNAFSQTSIISKWERSDLNHMAEAAQMLWEQANQIAARTPEIKETLSTSICKLFEPLLFWSGEYILAAKLAESRISQEPTDARIFSFLARSFHFAYVAHSKNERMLEFDKALDQLSQLAPILEIIDDQQRTRLFVAAMLYKVKPLATALIRRPIRHEADPLLSSAPKFWLQSYDISNILPRNDE